MDLAAIAKNYMSIWTFSNLHKLDTFADEDLLVDYSHFPEPVKGIENYKKVLEETYSYFPDISITINELIIAENRKEVTVRWTYKGTHKSGEIFGIKAEGKKVKVEGISILRIENQKVISEKGIVDNMSLLGQLKSRE